VTFLTTRTARVTSEDWVKGCDWWKTSTLLPVDVRVVKNVTCLSSLIYFLGLGKVKQSNVQPVTSS
jgi:hypothetical protein